MAHIEKFKKTEVFDLLTHNERKDDSHSHSNEDIDVTKSYLNYDLCTKEGTAYERFKKRLSEVECFKRDDVNVIDSLIVHLPTDVKKGDEKKFFEGIYAFACKDFGEENIVNANVHRDETRQHIHLGFIPVVEKLNKRKGITEKRVCHDKKITRSYYKNLHINLMKYMKNYLGYEVSILNGATANGNKTIQQLKAETLKNKNEELEKHIEETLSGLQVTVKELNNQIDELQEQKTNTEEEVQSLAEKSRDLKEEVAKFKKKNEESRKNLLDSIPPLVLEPYPPKPNPPEKPEWHNCYANKKEEKEDKRIWKQYDKDLATYNKTTLPNWKRACDEVDERNAKTRSDWENKYMTAENIKKAENQVSIEYSQANVYKQQAQEQLRKAEQEKQKAEQERKQAEQERIQQEENNQRLINQAVQQEIDRRFNDISTSRLERLEQFCDSIEYQDGSSVLEQFEQLEEELKEMLEI